MCAACRKWAPEASLTLTAHADGEALLQTAVLAAIAVELGHRAVLAAAARVPNLQVIMWLEGEST